MYNLLEKYREYSKKDNKNDTILHYAILSGITAYELNDLLSDEDSDYVDTISRKNTLGDTPLHYVSYYESSKEVIEVLLKYTLYTDFVNLEGKTPLMCIIQHNNKPELIELLVKHGSSMEHIDNKGNNMLHYSVMYPYIDVNYVSYQQDENTDVRKNYTLSYVADYFAENGIPIDSDNNDGETPLHLAATGQYYGSVESIEELLYRGANPSFQNNDGDTVLHKCLKNTDDMNVIKALFKNITSDLNSKNNNKETINLLVQTHRMSQEIVDYLNRFKIAEANRRREEREKKEMGIYEFEYDDYDDRRYYEDNVIRDEDAFEYDSNDEYDEYGTYDKYYYLNSV